MKKTIKKFMVKIAVSMLLTAVITCVFVGVSCNINPEGVKILTGSYESPKLLNYYLNSETKATLEFSKMVDLDFIEVYEVKANRPIQTTRTDLGQGKWCLDFLSNLDCTSVYSIKGNVIDDHGNTLYFKDKFQGYNNRIPKIIINEIRTEYSKPKCEFIEFIALESGNLGGMELTVAGDGIDNTYIFPAAEVKQGDYVVLHMRKLEPTCVNETGDDTDSSGGTESSFSRDLWIDNTNARIGTTDVILLKERVNGKLIDAVLFAGSDKSSWKTDFMSQCAQEAYNSGIWPGGSDVKNAVCSDGTKATRTLSRQSFNNGPANWIVTATGKATPGRENSMEVYVKQN